MARYVYFCSQCNREYEVDKPMVESSRNEPCPVCQKTGERVFTAPGMCIKGSPVRFQEKHDSHSGGCGGCCGDGHCSFS